MSIALNANFFLQSQNYLDARKSFATLAEMKNFPETSIPNGFITFNEETKKYYNYLTDNVEDPDLGKW